MNNRKNRYILLVYYFTQPFYLLDFVLFIASLFIMQLLHLTSLIPVISQNYCQDTIIFSTSDSTVTINFSKWVFTKQPIDTNLCQFTYFNKKRVFSGKNAKNERGFHGTLHQRSEHFPRDSHTTETRVNTLIYIAIHPYFLVCWIFAKKSKTPNFSHIFTTKHVVSHRYAHAKRAVFTRFTFFSVIYPYKKNEGFHTLIILYTENRSLLTGTQINAE